MATHPANNNPKKGWTKERLIQTIPGVSCFLSLSCIVLIDLLGPTEPFKSLLGPESLKIALLWGSGILFQITFWAFVIYTQKWFSWISLPKISLSSLPRSFYMKLPFFLIGVSIYTLIPGLIIALISAFWLVGWVFHEMAISLPKETITMRSDDSPSRLGESFVLALAAALVWISRPYGWMYRWLRR